MTGFVEALSDTIRNGVCEYLSTYNNFNDRLYGEGGLIGAIPRATGRTAYRMLCNREPPPEPEPLYRGGQCPVNYFFRVDFEQNVGSSSDNWQPAVATNIGGFAVPGALGDFYMDGLTQKWRTADPSNPIIIGGGNPTKPADKQVRNIQVTQLYRADGLPDNCGDPPPPPPPPPDPPSTSTNTSYETNNNTSVSIPVNLVYAPVNVNLNGHLSIPVRVNIPVDANVTFNANVDFNTGDIEFNFNDSNYSPGSKNPPSSYDSPSDTPDPPPDVPIDIPPPDPTDPEPDTIRLLRAAIVTVNIVPDGITEIFQEDNPNVFVPRLGNVQFLIRVGNRLAWTEEIAIKNKRQFVVCPWEGGAIDVRGTPQPNVVWNISPVYVIQEESVSF